MQFKVCIRYRADATRNTCESWCLWYSRSGCPVTHGFLQPYEHELAFSTGFKWNHSVASYKDLTNRDHWCTKLTGACELEGAPPTTSSMSPSSTRVSKIWEQTVRTNTVKTEKDHIYWKGKWIYNLQTTGPVWSCYQVFIQRKKFFLTRMGEAIARLLRKVNTKLTKDRPKGREKEGRYWIWPVWTLPVAAQLEWYQTCEQILQHPPERPIPTSTDIVTLQSDPTHPWDPYFIKYLAPFANIV